MHQNSAPLHLRAERLGMSQENISKEHYELGLKIAEFAITLKSVDENVQHIHDWMTRKGNEIDNLTSRLVVLETRSSQNRWLVLAGIGVAGVISSLITHFF